ncbi:divalent-cation tolerance protein CutA [Leptolyngbya sp. BL0902]|uniref:divalent-cation tolerance protein CutA n=1 Tax=Leptolyngbya sp. BL0902 TaxID=1115757 RepID=UPI0018E74442|nr:divalent-cation tolerance protein CutA [Leptolyngbya sp. BL0902]QQE64189.1 divalent-cation tolerance protein CutA [Leptolyngbya sp. BL0902]
MPPSLLRPGQPFGLVLVTIDSEANAQALAQKLVEARLAACVSLAPVQSIYRWQGAIQQEREWQLTLKTNLTRLEEITQFISQHHPYDVPEIIALPLVAGSVAYLNWLAEQTQPPPRAEA